MDSPSSQYASALGTAAPLDDFASPAQHGLKDVSGGPEGLSLDGSTKHASFEVFSLGNLQFEASRPIPLAVGSDARPEKSSIAVHLPQPAAEGAKRKRDSTDSSSGPPPSDPSHSHGSTPAGRLREQKLRDDVLVIIHSPQLVQCKRCDKMIKLSAKSTYDPVHWRKHKERCLKRSDAALQNIKTNAGKQHTPSWPIEAQIRTVPKRRRIESSATPSLTTDDSNYSDDRPSEGTLNEAEPPVGIIMTRALDLEFEEYLVRSHRRPTQEFLPLGDWKTWSWAQLKRPVWNVMDRAINDEGKDGSTVAALKVEERD